MTEIRSFLRALNGGYEQAFAALQRGLGHTPVVIPFHGYVTNTRIILRGRVVLGSKIDLARHMNRWAAVKTVWALYTALPLAGWGVEVTDGSASAVSDSDGYFEINLPVGVRAPGRHSIELRLASAPQIVTMSTIHVPPRQARLGVIALVEKGVLEIRRWQFWRAMAAASRGDLMARRFCPDTIVVLDHFSNHEQNPVAYIGESRWRLFPLIDAFLSESAIARGPLFLRKKEQDRSGANRDALMSAHKCETATQIMRAQPDLPHILIGDADSGDTPALLEIARKNGAQTRAVILRLPKNKELSPDTAQMIAELRAIGPIVYASSDLSGAPDALARQAVHP